MSHSAQSQSDPWVGTWTSKAYEHIYPDIRGTSKYKKVIRITKDAEGYLVRGKIINVYDPTYVLYLPDFTVTSVDNNTMYLTDSGDKVPETSNGIIKEYYDITRYYKLTRIRGGLHYSFYNIRCVYYSPNMVYQRTTEDPEVSKYSDSQLDLYPDDW